MSHVREANIRLRYAENLQSHMTRRRQSSTHATWDDMRLAPSDAVDVEYLPALPDSNHDELISIPQSGGVNFSGYKIVNSDVGCMVSTGP